MTKTNFQKYAGIALASTVVIGGIASAAITPIPVISNTFAVAGQVIKSADINKLAEALNILDARTNGTAPTDPNHLANKEYVDGKVASVGSSLTFGNPIEVSDLSQVYQATSTIFLTGLVYGTSDAEIIFCMADNPANFSGAGDPYCATGTKWVARAYNYASTSTIIPKGMYWKALTSGSGTKVVRYYPFQ